MAEDEKPRDQDALLAEAREMFGRCEEYESDNRQAFKDDMLFVRAREQWPEAIRKQRESEDRPCLTIDRLGPVVRQVVNDARQNKPAIKVHPVDDFGDKETAQVINGLIRNIEYTSNADTAYDTAVECAASGNIGYIRVGLDYAYDDSFDLDIKIDRVANPLSIYGDPNSTAADSSDWNVAFVVDRVPKDQFKARYPKASITDWDSDAWQDAGEWLNSDGVLVAEWWVREEVEKTIVKTTDGRTFDEAKLSEDEDLALALEAGLIQIATDALGQPLRRVTKAHRVIQRIMTGAEILSERIWPGKYIPIIPVYGDEFWIEGKRYLRSLINGAKDAQMMLNFWRTSGTELVALAPRVPFIGRKGAFDHDQERWETANTQSHAYLEYEGDLPPQRQPLDSGIAAGSMQEALNASDDIKAITGIYDASLGARSNETSGRAIIARQREGDISTFHFIDNLARAIRHTGRVIIDLIPHVYTGPRVVRVIGEDGSQTPQAINQQAERIDPATGEPERDEMGQVVMALHDLTAGKYDLVVTTGPSYSTMRAEQADQMMQLIQSYPDAAPLIGDILVKSLDWQGSDEIAERIKKMLPPQVSGEQSVPPEVQQAIQQGMERIQQLEQENEKLKADKSADMAKIQSDEQIELEKIASNERIEAAKIASQESIARQRVLREATMRNTPQTAV
ncbi:portal protein [Devosia honganensis]|uniref:Portal protein n=1 Tax=Devosia honganensis TaxID=1610527 RepID=A0ABV7X3Y6_9HYPH